MTGWLMRVEGGLAASFKQPDGTSRPGTDWKIGIKRGDVERLGAPSPLGREMLLSEAMFAVAGVPIRRELGWGRTRSRSR